MKLCERLSIQLLCAVILSVMLCACNAAPATVSTPGNAEEAVEILNISETELPEIADVVPEVIYPVNDPARTADETVVSTVDELLAAIGPDRTVYMEAGTYTLTEAKDYGKKSASDHYTWEKVNDGYELSIHDAENLRIVGHSANDTEIRTTPRYASVIGFRGCDGISVQGLTAGHTDGPGTCAGAVLYFSGTDGVSVTDSVLYGCGTLGLELHDCTNALAQNCTIKACSLGAVSVVRGKNVQIENCRMRDCGQMAGSALSMLSFTQSESVAVIDCTIERNTAMYLLESSYSRDVQLLGSVVQNNSILQAVFVARQFSPLVEGCAFSDNFTNAWYDVLATGVRVHAVSKAGKVLQEKDFFNMQLEDIPYEAPEPSAPVELDAANMDGMREVQVSTVDEFLTAIAPNTTVRLADGAYDLSAASNYGAYGADHYYWLDEFDGPALVIDGVSNFHIVGGGAGKVSISSIPRYADVILYQSCENVSLTGVTLGHSEGPGECTGGVLRFSRTHTVRVQDCGLYGCGIRGVTGSESSGFTIDGTEIYDCSQGVASFTACKDVAFTDCDIHDCGEPSFSLWDCENITLDGKPLESQRSLN